jgi:hypothetical protein
MNPSNAGGRGWSIDLNRMQSIALAIGLLGTVLSIFGWVVSPDQFFHSYLVAYLLWLGVALGSISLLMIHHMTGGNWGWSTRYLFESSSRTLPLMVVLIVPIFIGIPHLYLWSHADAVAKSSILQHKAGYLNFTWFLIRAIIYFVIWLVMMFLLNRSAGLPLRMRKVSGPGLVIHAIVITLAAVDWLMSLEPEWFSTMFGLVVIIGQLLSAMGIAIVMLTLASDRRVLGGFTAPSRFHDIGNLMLAFVMLWAYTSFSQFLIIWAGNLPDEIPFYKHRFDNGWQWIALVLVLFHFAVPFLLLLSRYIKKRAELLMWVAICMIVMRFVDLFWIVQPAHLKNLQLHWLDPVVPIGIGGLWFAMFLWQLKRQPLPIAPLPAEGA